MDTVQYQFQNPKVSKSSDVFEFNSYGNQTSSSTSYKNDINSIDTTNIIQHSPFTKHNDLKAMLESNKDGLKLEAMKKLIIMIAKGKISSDASAKQLFPNVVKNVVTKNAELKKLVYLYLLRYAEQEPDLILLSISTFQRSLKDPNPLMRASALRVMSSIRVNIIAPIMYISIKDCSNDMSPYVRKTAAHAIPKLYSLEPSIKDDIILIIDKLLQDRTSLVLGSAVAAFEEVCPDRFDLIHLNYRKFVSLMADFDEWGQVILIKMLIRYGRVNFLNPNIVTNNLNNDDDYDSGLINLDPDHHLLLRNAKPLLQSRNSAVVMAVIQLYLYLAPNSELNSSIVRPLIRLLNSKSEIQKVILTNIVSLTVNKDLHDENLDECAEKKKNTNLDDNLENISLNESNLEVRKNSQSDQLRNLFEPYLKSFYVKSKDSTQVRILKLKILVNLSSSSNIPLILREFQAYINNYQDNMEFVSATIEAIGKCASRIKEIAPVCLNGLISLLSNRNEKIIAQSIIVIRKQIINKQIQINKQILLNQEKKKNFLSDSLAENKSNTNEPIEDGKSDHIINLVIKQVSKLIIDKIKTPNAKATILWILAEFCDKNKKAYQISPDILRLIAKTFLNESEIVKLQAINLASKIYLTVLHFETIKNYFNAEDKERIKLLINYIFNLAKYDLNYDVRDRARFLKQLINNTNNELGLKLAYKILMAQKNTFIENKLLKKEKLNEVLIYSNNVLPCLVNGASKYRIGTLSHFLNKTVNGYQELPDYPVEKPDSNVRNKLDEDLPKDANKNSCEYKKKTVSSDDKFYSDEEIEEETDDSESSSSDFDESSFSTCSNSRSNSSSSSSSGNSSSSSSNSSTSSSTSSKNSTCCNSSYDEQSINEKKDETKKKSIKETKNLESC